MELIPEYIQRFIRPCFRHKGIMKIVARVAVLENGSQELSQRQGADYRAHRRGS